ncbi:lipoprotein signal peptidase [Siphonobacter aquaeclarae]|uniref:Lipoprotein signal peptidase n=1 Tax=Siphonobacter aquaeclarae TaxID=563176 RepID=A0A1G9XNH4_9BACT|nr:lipoprotein signal peptidase [Siphonobacter aquaeclarae]SDM98290.1 signal peptidase II Aspartic peptidase. MEROPS family A08 [Siphonobacter aquaeclarae]
MKNPIKFFLLTLFIILLDQTVKLLVYRNMYIGENIPLLGDWLSIHYVLNPGMAFGMQLDHQYGKLILTTFRLVAMVVIAVYLIRLAKKGAPDGLLWCIAAILAGAIGNVIDSTFYGVLLDNAPPDAPSPWFHGQVIDMILINPWEGYFPDWLPVWGGQYYANPVFNVADSSIFLGVVFILLFQSRFFNEKPTDTTPELPTEPLSDEPVSPDEKGEEREQGA